MESSAASDEHLISKNIKDIIKAFESCASDSNKCDFNSNKSDQKKNDFSNNIKSSENPSRSNSRNSSKRHAIDWNKSEFSGSKTPASSLDEVPNGRDYNFNTKDRVQRLEKQLRRTIDRTFSDVKEEKSQKHKTSDESSNESNEQDVQLRNQKDDITTKFETYVRTIRIFSEGDKTGDKKNLFTCCLLVGLMGKTPYIKSKFPKNVEVPYKIEELCFPDVVGGPMDDSNSAQCYSLVITRESGERTYGYCRRVIPEGSRYCLPLVYCILSDQRAPRFYRRVLEEIESRHGLPDKVLDALLTEFYEKNFPKPGHSVRFDLSKVKEALNNSMKSSDCAIENGKETRRLSGDPDPDLNSFMVVGRSGEYGTLNRLRNCNSEHSGNFQGSVEATGRRNSSPDIQDEDEPSEIVLTLHQDSRYKETDLEKFCTTINKHILRKIFASLLLERKVILVSCVLSQLSSCIEALQSILYPFSWPHTLIPVLPQTLWEIVEAPTPLICGVLSVSVVNEHKIENGIVVDLDEGAILLEVGDEDKILPSCLVKSWEKGLAVANGIPKNEHAHNILLNDAFLRVFIDCCGHYKDFIVDGQFLKDDFIEHPTSKGRRRFLKWFTETTMFSIFIDSIVNKSLSYPIFDKRIQIYSSPESDAILEKMKDWKRDKSNTLRYD